MIAESELIAAGYSRALCINHYEYEKVFMHKRRRMFGIVFRQQTPNGEFIARLAIHDVEYLSFPNFHSLAEVEALFALLAKGVSVTLSELRDAQTT